MTSQRARGSGVVVPGGAVTVVNAQPGVSVETDERESLRFDAAERSDEFVYAEPAG